MRITRNPQKLFEDATLRSDLRASAAQSLSALFEEPIEMDLGSAPQSHNIRANVRLEGDLTGAVILTTTRTGIAAMSRRLLGEEAVDEIRTAWEVANIVGGNFTAVLESHGIDVSLSSVKSLTKLPDRGSPELVLLLQGSAMGEPLQVAVSVQGSRP